VVRNDSRVIQGWHSLLASCKNLIVFRKNKLSNKHHGTADIADVSAVLGPQIELCFMEQENSLSCVRQPAICHNFHLD
jgi:hypothetical protein